MTIKTLLLLIAWMLGLCALIVIGIMLAEGAIITHSHCPNHSKNNSENMHTHDTSDPDHNEKHKAGHPHTWEFDEHCPKGYERDTRKKSRGYVPTPTKKKRKADTDTDDDTESETSEPIDTDSVVNTFHGGRYIPKPPTDFFITHTRLRNNPYTLFIYVRNDSGRFMRGIILEIVNADDTPLYKGVLSGHFTPQTFKLKGRNAGFANPDGADANNLIAVANISTIKAWDYRKEPHARFKVGVTRFRKRYSEGAIIRLIWKHPITKAEVVVSAYPEPEIAASPMLTRGKMTTTWAAMKENR